MKDGFIKVAAGAPRIRVADPAYNAAQVIACIERAAEKGVKLLVLPELCLTGATCGHLFRQRLLTDAALAALRRVMAETAGVDMLVFAGLPVAAGGRLFSAAAAIYKGELLGLTARQNTADTVFSPLSAGDSFALPELDYALLAAGQVYPCPSVPGLAAAAQFAADRRLPAPPQIGLCAAGATVIAELSDEPMRVWSKARTAEELRVESRRLHAGWLYAAPGEGESTTDRAYAGLCMVVDDGELLAADESGESLAVSELDIYNLTDARARARSFDGLARHECFGPEWRPEPVLTELTRPVRREPLVPEEGLEDFCERALDIQARGVIQRMTYTGCMRPVIGVSGGVDSTLVMLACARALDRLGLPRKNLVAITMPCFGTTDRTKSNAVAIAERLGAELRVVPIGEDVKRHFETIGHDPDDHSVVFENAQARVRTMVLLDVANKVGGIDVGTKDLSEQADGWCTYNGDQISNYDINAGLSKTMVRAVVRYIAERCGDAELAAALTDILDTPVTPELLPISDEGELLQKSEDAVGPYVLQDFFLYHMVMRGASPAKVLRLGELAFRGEFDRETIRYWLRSYCRRFFTQQFKRSASADGPDVMGFTLSPRDGHRMPSDAAPDLWLGEAEKL